MVFGEVTHRTPFYLGEHPRSAGYAQLVLDAPLFDERQSTRSGCDWRPIGTCSSYKLYELYSY